MTARRVNSCHTTPCSASLYLICLLSPIISLRIKCGSVGPQKSQATQSAKSEKTKLAIPYKAERCYSAPKVGGDNRGWKMRVDTKSGA